MIKRIRISDLQRNGLLIPGASGLVRFEDGSSAVVTCISTTELQVDHMGHRSLLEVVYHQLRKVGQRPYFLVAGRRVMDVYHSGMLGFTSRFAADMRHESEPTARPFRIPRKGSEDYARLSIQVMR
ncbi:hypothetical protein SAMN05880582_101657 [Rhizobium sp. RU20A]|uniref:hypothetical protein n=1 Tax=Rhizobium sp. RU20A TaxID=1907412 RepID=UPI0009569ADD|nr:hypothetical protein [Rhizobium sp. RU20A]SIQ08222.1 hypothetical protein SAMN05880582_101657 [Rhizobium sp. RU20A]